MCRVSCCDSLNRYGLSVAVPDLQVMAVERGGGGRSAALEKEGPTLDHPLGSALAQEPTIRSVHRLLIIVTETFSLFLEFFSQHICCFPKKCPHNPIWRSIFYIEAFWSSLPIFFNQVDSFRLTLHWFHTPLKSKSNSTLIGWECFCFGAKETPRRCNPGLIKEMVARRVDERLTYVFKLLSSPFFKPPLILL